MGGLRVRTLILLAIALGLFESRADAQRPGAGARKVAVTVARSKTETVTHRYQCTAYGPYSTAILATADGSLAEVSVKEGQTVRKGDPLFTIRPLKDEEKPKAEDRDRADLAEPGQAVIESDPLFRLLPREYFEEREADHPDRVLSIKAPSEGVVGRLTRQPGRVVRRGDLLTDVVQNRSIYAHFQMSERDFLEYAAEWLRSRQSRRVELTLADGSKFPHAAESCEALAGSSRDADIHFSARFPNPDGLLRRGRRGTVSVRREWKDAIVLPRQSTFRDRNRTYVFVVDEGHVAHPRAIVIGDGTDDFVVVKEGVGVGDRVVVEGVGHVRDGDNVDY